MNGRPFNDARPGSGTTDRPGLPCAAVPEAPTRSAAAPALLALAWAGSLALTGCGDPVASSPEPLLELPRQLSSVERATIDANNAFGLDLLSRVYEAESGPNVFLSPISASMALGMALNGAAEGEVWDGMSEALHFGGLSETQINQSYRDLLDLLQGLDDGVAFNIGNSVWTRLGMPVEATFVDRVETWFDAVARAMDFADPATVDAINAWASDATHGRIPSILEEINPLRHGFFLLNATYFNGSWTDRFDPARTTPEPFHLEDGSTVQVPLMSGKLSVDRRFMDDATVAHLPYGRRDFVMTVVVPRGERTLGDVVAGLDVETWERWTELPGPAFESAPIDVKLPTFELQYGVPLNDPLKAMGMDAAFVVRTRSFPRLTPSPESWIQHVQQQTFVRVDEAGTEAAAVTTVAGAVPISAPRPFVVDRPFLFAIRERLSGTILFIGAIGDPR